MQFGAPANEYDPAEQAAQLEAPANDEKVPAAHAEHVAAAADEDPSGPKLPAAQGAPVHTFAPGADEKVPAAHAEQVAAAADEDPRGPKLPTAHGVLEQTDAPGAGEKVPATH